MAEYRQIYREKERERERAAMPLAWKAVGERAELGRKQWPLSLVNDATPASAAASSSVVLAALRRASRCACRDYRVRRAISKRRRSRRNSRSCDLDLVICPSWKRISGLLICFNLDCSNVNGSDWLPGGRKVARV